MHSSYLSGLGGKKMQLEITTAVLTTGSAMLNQMAEAKAKKETREKGKVVKEKCIYLSRWRSSGQ
jgi:hypothetical protein